MDTERGQASVEWVALVLCVALALGGVVAFVPLVDGRSLGAALAHAIVCAVRGDCERAEGDKALLRVGDAVGDSNCRIIARGQ